jgi:hypothetical protein
MSPCILRFTLVFAACALTACSTYSKATRQRPGHTSSSSAGQLIAQGQKLSNVEPRTKIGSYLDAVAAASLVLGESPRDAQALTDYNFAVARIFEVVHETGLEPWKQAVPCPGANHVWTLGFKSDPRPDHNPVNFSLEPADLYKFKGRLVVPQSGKSGLGAPLVARSNVPDATKIDPFAQGKHIYYGVTGMVDAKGNDCILTLHDPLSTETVSLAGNTYPLAANFTAPIALALAELKPRKKELGGLFKPDEFETGPRLARLQPYDPKKIPILCIQRSGRFPGHLGTDD